MATVLDLLKAPEFAARRLTETINIPPYRTGRLAQLGIFQDEPIATTYVRLLIQGGTITVIPARQRGAPANKNMREGEAVTLIQVPHFPLGDAIGPSDIQNLTDIETLQLLTLASVLNGKLSAMNSKHQQTWNHLDWGALAGIVVDAEGKQLANLWDTFGITQTSMSFALGNTATDIASKNGAVKSLIRKVLNGLPSTGVRVFAGANWYDAYVGHQFVREALKYYPGATPNPARDDIQDTFDFRGLTVEKIDETFPHRLADGTFESLPAINANEAVAIPLGSGIFKRYIAPPDTVQDANNVPQPGEKIFVSTEPLPHGKGEDIWTESNILPICTRPDAMIKLTM